MTSAFSTRRSPETTTAARRSLAWVADNRILGSLVWLTLEVPGWPGARPGQFALLQAQGSRCFLGRALSIAREQGELVSFLVAPVGGGTRELCGLREGARVWALGPLGNGFDLRSLSSGPGRLVAVAGGVGAAPFPLLLARLPTETAEPGSAGGGVTTPLAVLVLLGFRDAAQAAGAEPVAEAAQALAERGVICRTEVATEDGAIGRCGKVTDVLRDELRPGDRVAACGPWAMTESVARICGEVPGVDACFSLEAGMACGVGSCHGCVIPLVDGTYARVCREGPVFTARDLFGSGGPAAREVEE